MSKAIACFLVALFMLALPGCDDESAEIKAVWESYETARAAGNAEGVIAICDPKNIEHFGELVELAKYADRTKLERLDPMDRLYVLALRYEKKPEELRVHTGLGMAREAYSRPAGLLGGPYEVTLGKVTMRPPRAFAELLVDGEQTNFRIDFLKANDKWHIDLQGQDRMFTSILEKIAHQSNKNMDDVITRLAASSTGNLASGKVWDPPLKKP